MAQTAKVFFCGGLLAWRLSPPISISPRPYIPHGSAWPLGETNRARFSRTKMDARGGLLAPCKRTHFSLTLGTRKRPAAFLFSTEGSRCLLVSRDQNFTLPLPKALRNLSREAHAVVGDTMLYPNTESRRLALEKIIPRSGKGPPVFPAQKQI